jgi:hypothetical protein
LASSCGIGQGSGKRVHRRIVAQAGTDVGHLLDQHGGVLAGELREGAVRTTGAGRQVASTTDLVGFFAALLVALELQRFALLAAPGRSTCNPCSRCPRFLGAGGQRQRRYLAIIARADRQNQFFIATPSCQVVLNDAIVNLAISPFWR